MRFSAAVQQGVPREPAPELVARMPLERAPAMPQQPAPRAAQEPPPDLDQRVRLSGEW